MSIYRSVCMNVSTSRVCVCVNKCVCVHFFYREARPVLGRCGGSGFCSAVEGDTRFVLHGTMMSLSLPLCA